MYSFLISVNIKQRFSLCNTVKLHTIKKYSTVALHVLL